MKDDDRFETSDFNLAAVLMAAGVTLIDVDKTNPRCNIFIFNASDEMNGIASQFWSRTLKLDPSSIFSAQKLLRSQLNH